MFPVCMVDPCCFSSSSLPGMEDAEPGPAVVELYVSGARVYIGINERTIAEQSASYLH